MANVNIKPLGDRVLLEICENTEEMMGGILIPDSAKEKPQEYRVIALGTGKNDDNGNKIPFDVKEGDIVLIDQVFYSQQGIVNNVSATVLREMGTGYVPHCPQKIDCFGIEC